jgi:Fe-S cluster assembly protein SufD
MSTTVLSAIRPAAVKSAAERALGEAFAKSADALPGTGWVKGLRADAMRRLEAAGLPTRRVEAFKYTDLRERVKEAFGPVGTPSRVTAADVDAALGGLADLDAARIVLVDGVFSAELSQLGGLVDAVEQMPLGPLLTKAPSWLEGKFSIGRLGEETALTALNTAFMSDGLMIKVKPGQRVQKPVLIVSVVASAEPATTAQRHIIAMEADASMTLVEAFVALPGASPKGLVSALSDVTVADGATLHHVKCVLDAASAAHLGCWVAKIGANATYRGFQLSAGPRLVRNDVLVELGGEGGKLDLSGAFLGRDTNHLDTTLVVDHKVPGCESRELFKGVLADRARGVFQGKIIVRPGADQTDGKQMARALLLSEDAEFDSKPELEIYADDVACGHGATAAALDDDLMFYCLSRGIPEAEARVLLIEAFIGDAVEKIEDEALRYGLMQAARLWLAGEAA